jgi:ABC-type amino acid transport substrate-binding protein
MSSWWNAKYTLALDTLAPACYLSSLQSRKVGNLRRYVVLYALLVVLSIAPLPTVAACGGSQETTTTARGTGTTAAADDATTADAAIASVTKSDRIETPATIEAGFLQAGCDVAFPPMEYMTVVDKKRTAVGFDVDLCTAIAKKMGLELKVVAVAWDGIVPVLENGQVDIIMSAMITSPALLEQVSATDPYLSGDLAISAPVGAPIADAADLVGKTVGVQIDSTAQTAVEEVEGVKEIRTYSQISDAFQDLAAGQLDAVVNDEPASLWIIENSPDYKDKYANTGRLETGEGYAYWCTKDNEALLAAMNTALGELRDEGVYQKICDKWGLTGN